MIFLGRKFAKLYRANVKMICVHSELIKDYLDKCNISANETIKSGDNVIYIYDENECVNKAIRDYISY